MVAGTPTRRLSDVIADVKAKFGDTSGAQLTDADITRWTNAAQLEIVSRNGFNKTKATGLTTVGVQSYVLPSDVIQLESVAYNGLILAPVGFEDAQRRTGSDQFTTGVPQIWYTW